MGCLEGICPVNPENSGQLLLSLPDCCAIAAFAVYVSPLLKRKLSVVCIVTDYALSQTMHCHGQCVVTEYALCIYALLSQGSAVSCQKSRRFLTVKIFCKISPAGYFAMAILSIPLLGFLPFSCHCL